jgi:hypothetical protein
VSHCDNGLQDCGEADVDCGGDCSACAPEMLWGNEAEGKHPSVLAAAPDRVLVAFGRHDRSTPIQYSCFDGATWTPLADATAANSWRPNPVADSTGTIHMAWNSYAGAGPQSVYYSTYSGSCSNGSWSAPELVSHGAQTTFSSTEPCVDIDENDVVWIGWSQARGDALTGVSCTDSADCVNSLGADYYCRSQKCWPYYDIHVSRRIGGAWEAPTNITDGLTGYFSHLALSVVRSDLAYATWMKGDGVVKIWWSRWDGATWSAPANTTLGLQFSEVVADEDYVHLLVNGSSRYRRKTVGGAWDSAVSLGSSAMDFPDLTLDDLGVLHAVWNGNGQIHYRIGDAATGTWPDPAVPISPTPAASHPWISVDANGFAHIVWTGGEDHGPVWYYKIRYDDL